jgi:hypothetical protein
MKQENQLIRVLIAQDAMLLIAKYIVMFSRFRERYTKLLLAGGLVIACGLATAQNTYPEYRCPDGEYAGPKSGKTRYIKDPYTWYVTREFAARFCMPEEFISDELKGAEAIAFRYKPDEVETCGWGGDREVCNRGHMQWLEIYVKSSANIPKYDPEVGFFVRDTFTSGHTISNAQDLRNADRRRVLQWNDPLGRRPPFFGGNRRDDKPRTSFILLGVQADETVRYKTVFVEDYYRENWVDGINLIGVQLFSSQGRAAAELTRRLDKKEAIGVLVGYRGNESQTREIKRRLPDFLHVIELPKRLTDQMIEIGIRAEDQLENLLRRAMPPASAASAPTR